MAGTQGQVGGGAEGREAMTDADLHREEWIAERAGILEFEAGYPREIAEVMARVQWTEYDRGRRAA